MHRKGITFSSQELSQTPQNKLQAMTSHCVKTINPYHPRRNMVSAPPAIKKDALFPLHTISCSFTNSQGSTMSGVGAIESQRKKKKKKKEKDKAVQSQFKRFIRDHDGTWLAGRISCKVQMAAQ